MSESAVKLHSVTINRDLSVNKTLKVSFSIQSISVIYGENGCGKTTFLRCLSAVLAQNESILLQEKVVSIKIEYFIEHAKKTVEIKKVEEEEPILDENNNPIKFIRIKYDWTNFLQSEIKDIKSILFGVNRGLSNSLDVTEDDILNTIFRARFQEVFKTRSEMVRFAHSLQRSIEIRHKNIRGRDIKNLLDLSDPSLTIDGVSMEVIEEVLVTRVNYAKKISTSKVIKALFDTFADACDLNVISEDVSIDAGEYRKLLLDNRDRLITALKSEENNTIIERIVKILENVSDNQEILETGQNQLLRKLIYNMIQELNRESETLRSINKLLEVYNEYIGPDKYLEITDEAAIVKFFDSEDSHNIDALSSGEKHLLVLLTIFVIEGSNRQLFMVDEPEISLNMKWQKKLLPLLHELAPNAEIIVASHSPSIAHENSQYLVELERHQK